VRLNTIGDLEAFPKDIKESVKKWIEISQNNTKITVTFALNYGGRDEITRGVNSLLGKEPVSQDDIGASLDTVGMPDPDLIIRPGGEQRLSGLMPWQSVYTELYFTEVLMPDFSPTELDKALSDYAERQRRFGK
jgi:undecaprenyl diphosphate synthase